jgi:hypothetical protein
MLKSIRAASPSKASCFSLAGSFYHLSFQVNKTKTF